MSDEVRLEVVRLPGSRSKQRRRSLGSEILDANPERPDSNQHEGDEDRKNPSIIARKREVPGAQFPDDRRGFRLNPGEDLLDAVAEGAIGQRLRVVVDFGGDIARCSAPNLVLSELDDPHGRPRQPRIAEGGEVGAGHCVLIHSIKCTPPTKSGAARPHACAQPKARIFPSRSRVLPRGEPPEAHSFARPVAGLQTPRPNPCPPVVPSWFLA